jgi:hypothetical protein
MRGRDRVRLPSWSILWLSWWRRSRVDLVRGHILIKRLGLVNRYECALLVLDKSRRLQGCLVPRACLICIGRPGRISRVGYIGLEASRR